MGKRQQLSKQEQLQRHRPAQQVGMHRTGLEVAVHREAAGSQLLVGPGARRFQVHMAVGRHGARGGDEINRPQAGKNHGWPLVSFGVNYDGSKIGSGDSAGRGLEAPLHHWTPSTAPSGMAFLTSDRYGAGWKGNLFVGSLKFEYLDRIELKDGKVMRSGRVDDLNVAPQQTAKVKLDLGTVCQCAEWLLNVSYKLKEREGLLPAGHIVAKDQLTLNAYQAPAMDLKNTELSNVEVPAPVIQENDCNYLIVSGEAFRMEFNKHTGYLTKYEVNGLDMIKEGEALTPNFWRAPTDNDFGANLQRKYAVWKNPEIKLTSFSQHTENGQVIVDAAYKLPEASAELSLTYVINNSGAVKITQKMVADKNAKVANLFRFGMQMPMPRSFETVEYYGRGPVENYADRNHCTDLGIYRQSVSEQFYPYIRPQENGTKTDIRWWKMLDAAGNGIEAVAAAPFSASALHYTIESLDEGWSKRQGHSQEVEEADLTNFCIDKVQAGLGCEDSWGRIARPEYQVPYADYEFTFILTPVRHNIGIQ